MGNRLENGQPTHHKKTQQSSGHRVGCAHHGYIRMIFTMSSAFWLLSSVFPSYVSLSFISHRPSFAFLVRYRPFIGSHLSSVFFNFYIADQSFFVHPAEKE